MLFYQHVDVFSAKPFGGNSLPVFIDPPLLSTPQMLAITQELRHFEAIFVEADAPANTVRARVFDQFEELPFAGHPLLGAAAVLQRASGVKGTQIWKFLLTDRAAQIETQWIDDAISAWLDQGVAEFVGGADADAYLAGAFNLDLNDLDPRFPPAVVNTGLRYLIVPVRSSALPRAKITKDITTLVRAAGAQFAVLLDEDGLEIRHWNNDGVMEDVATGSAAGTIGAYRLRHCGARDRETFVLRQGRFAGRPSELLVQPRGSCSRVRSVRVGGLVSFVGTGSIEVLP